MSSGAGKAVAAGSSTISATYGAQSATLALTIVDGTLITPSPSSLSLTAGGTATPFTVTCRKANGTTDASPTYSATSSDTSIATVSKSGTTVTVTPVAAGNCTIDLSYTDVTSPATASVAVAVTASAGTVTSVTPYYGTDSVSSGWIFYNTTPVTFTAKDQGGNALDGTVGAWSTIDAVTGLSSTGLTITSAGVATPSAYCAGVIRYTHTASGHTADIPFNVFPSGFSVIGNDSAENYATNADLYANIWNDVGNVPGATGGSGVKYNTGDDMNVTAITVTDADAKRKFMGKRTFLQTFPASSASPGGGLVLRMPAGLTRGYIIRVERVAPSGEVGPSGTAAQFAMFSNSGSPAFAEKSGPCFGYPPGMNARAEIGYTGGSTKAGDCLYDWFIVDNNGLGTGSASYAEPTVSNGKDDFTLGGGWLIKILLVEQRTQGLWSMRVYRAPVGSVPVLEKSVLAEMATVNYSGTHLDNANAFSLNWNTSRDSDQLFYRNIADYYVVDGDAAGDPLGLHGTQAAPTLTSIDVSSIAHGATSVTVTLTGTNFNDNCYPVFSNAGIHVTPKSAGTATGNGANLVRTGSTTFAVTIDCASGATTGAGTVAIYNAASQTTSGTLAFTVT